MNVCSSFSTRQPCKNIFYFLMIYYFWITNDHICVSFVVILIRCFPYLWLIIEFVTIVTQRVSYVEQEFGFLLEHLNSPPEYSGVPVARSLVFYLVVCRSVFVLCPHLLSIILCVLLWFTLLIRPVVSSNVTSTYFPWNKYWLCY